MLEAWLPPGNRIAGISVIPSSTSLRDVAAVQRLVFSLPSETWVKAGDLGQMLKVIPGWLQEVSVQGLSEREIYPCSAFSPIAIFHSLTLSLLIRSLIAHLYYCALGEMSPFWK